MEGAATNIESSQPEIIPNSNLKERTAGSLATHSWADPNVILRGGTSGNAGAPKPENKSRNPEGVSANNQSLLTYILTLDLGDVRISFAPES